MSSRFVEPKDKKVLIEQTPESLRRKKLACLKVSHAYIPNNTIDRAQIITSIYAQKYSKNVRRRLMTLLRAKIRPDQFEVNSDLDIQTDGKVTEALMYGAAVYVDHPDDPVGTNILASCREVHGAYQRPYASILRDDLGNVTDSTIKYWRWMFWIPFTKQNVTKVLDEFGGEYRDIALGYAQESGNSWFGDRIFAVKNLEEFVSSSFEDVVAANLGGFLRTESGGVDLYLKDKQDKRKKMEIELQEFRKSDGNSSRSNKAKN